MAGRGFSAAALAEMGARQCVTGHLVDVELDAGTVYMTDLARPVIFGGHTYAALGHLLGFDAIQETADLQIPEVRLQLSGVDQTWIARVLAQPLVDRRVVIYQAFLNATTLALIVDPSAIFDGRISDSSIDESTEQGSSVVTVSASSHWADFERRPGRHTNHAEQQVHFEGDLGFEFVSEINRQIVWGRPA